jgi:ribosomal-protein-alanine N-acetyltransferase
MRAIDARGLLLEPQTVKHAEEMFVVLSDPAIYEYENQPPVSVEWLRTRFGKLESRRSADGTEQWLNWVVRIDGGGLIGYVQATVRADGSAAIAYELSSAHWGRGLGRRAVEAMLVELVARYRVSPPAGAARLRSRRSRPPRPERDRARRGSDEPGRGIAVSRASRLLRAGANASVRRLGPVRV